jgi:hypothetical protein
VGLVAEVDPVGLAESVAVLAAVLGVAVNVALGLVAQADPADRVAPAVSVRSGHSDRNDQVISVRCSGGML